MLLGRSVEGQAPTDSKLGLHTSAPFNEATSGLTWAFQTVKAMPSNENMHVFDDMYHGSKILKYPSDGGKLKMCKLRDTCVYLIHQSHGIHKLKN